MTDPLLAIDGVRFSYPGGRPVLDGASLTIATGELLALVGPNGVGKTTLLRIAAGTLQPTAGTVELEGRPMADWTRRDIARRIAVLPQQSSLPPGFRVEEVVAMGRAPHASHRFGVEAADEEAVERALVEARADDLVGRRVESLSGGERQRVQVALALAQETRLLLLDEPTAHLDISHQQTLLATLNGLRRQRGLAVVVVLHDIALARAAVPRVAVLGRGRILADGAPEEVLSPSLVGSVFDLSAAAAASYVAAAGGTAAGSGSGGL
jgi:iron complex transport system ATP-binding protein